MIFCQRLFIPITPSTIKSIISQHGLYCPYKNILMSSILIKTHHEPKNENYVKLLWFLRSTVYPKKYAHGVVVLCFVVVMQSFIMNSHEVFIHIHQGCFAGTRAIVRLPQCQWSKPDGYGKISQCITTTKHSKSKTVCIFLGIWYTVSEVPNCVVVGC